MWKTHCQKSRTEHSVEKYSVKWSSFKVLATDTAITSDKLEYNTQLNQEETDKKFVSPVQHRYSSAS